MEGEEAGEAVEAVQPEEVDSLVEVEEEGGVGRLPVLLSRDDGEL